ncbi:baseplate J/gp47 family protein [Shinella sp. JR1-6]|uniref:baseplate J/gp47 family protein n=1 Tax=Shinella sp. JR1-6 TaxID=2527671 RepID=UPI00102D5B1D|nr:baseplate J/gp47 family protein [Shinella sp. JR1-6]TAA54635.1 hypothetical protein EXZ48_26785 [Shinella sp. JR1-6]
MTIYVGELPMAQLPAPQLVEVEFEKAFDARKEKLVELLVLAGYPITVQDLEFDPYIILQRADNIREMLCRVAINDVYKQTLIAFAVKGALDHFAAQFTGLLRQPDEKDERFRRRIIAEIQNRSGGRLSGYQADCMNFSPVIEHVGAWYDRSNPLQPTVRLALMAEWVGAWQEVDAGAPMTTRLNWVGNTGAVEANLVIGTQEYIDREDVKQATDIVHVTSSQVIETVLDLTMFHLRGPDPALLRRAGADAVAKMAADRKQPHRDLPRSAIEAAASVGGAERVALNTPPNGISAGYGQLIHVSSIIIRSALTDV